MAEQVAIMKEKYITSQRCPFYQVYAHELEMTAPILLLPTASGAFVATTEGSE